MEACGLKNHNQPNNGLDVSDREGAGNKKPSIHIAPAPVWGLYQTGCDRHPADKGRTYLLTANEGAPRNGYSDLKKAKLALPKNILGNAWHDSRFLTQ